MNHKLIVGPLLAAALFGGCSSQPSATKNTASSIGNPSSNAAKPGAGNDQLSEAELGHAKPVHSVGDVYLAGQPSESDFPGLAQRGIKTVLSLRKPNEIDWDEAAAVQAAGMTFVTVPFDGPDELTDDVFERVRKELNQHGAQPLVLHCARANRVGAVWMVHRVLDHGVGVDAALEEAKAIGLRTPEYIEKAKDFIRRAQAQHAPVDSATDGNLAP